MFIQNKKIYCLALMIGAFLTITLKNAQADVGFPYIDVNHEPGFQKNIDIGSSKDFNLLKIINTEGKFDTSVARTGYTPPANPASLVIPDGASIKGKLGVNVELVAGDSLIINGKIDSKGDIKLVSKGLTSVVDLSYGSLKTKTGSITVQTNNMITLLRTKISAGKNVTLNSARDFDANRLKLRADQKVVINVGLTSDTDLHSLSLTESDVSANDISIVVNGANIDLSESDFDGENSMILNSTNTGNFNFPNSDFSSAKLDIKVATSDLTEMIEGQEAQFYVGDRDNPLSGLKFSVSALPTQNTVDVNLTESSIYVRGTANILAESFGPVAINLENSNLRFFQYNFNNLPITANGNAGTINLKGARVNNEYVP